ncbi:hypothetical protein BKA67DRAFT_286363 [Truncatella angustata]|uniref:Rhodopsin domain-containing protein n=1 Tax=Truncatella angustata TaxID=152316 RepID=A0A9P8ULB4_9PEZI|nr:uncharacterized protein BKA67DRAFT_286363 [Truncatella angustata]KAH6654655.1 hypothetical protein BKA67DRAFT_286363 [Truncatella angustata]
MTKQATEEPNEKLQSAHPREVHYAAVSGSRLSRNDLFTCSKLYLIVAMSAETPFQAEGWVEYTLGVVILLLRIYARWKTVGFKNSWKGDDIFSLIALVLWTMDITVVTIVGRYDTNIGVTKEQAAAMSPEEISRREFGSKWLFTGWNTYVSLIWALKGCMLCFFNRVTLGLSQQKIVKWAGIGCVTTYLIMFIIIYTQCLPVTDNWRVSPIPGYNCSVKTANYIAVAVLNITTDMVIVAIPIPLLFAVKLTIMRKLAIGALLCSGVFVMVATLLRCVLSLQNVEAINTCTIWAIRETFVAIIAVNAAAIKPLFSSKRWIKSTSKDGTGSNTPGYKGSNTYALSGKSKTSNIRSALPFHTTKVGTQILSSSEEDIVSGKTTYSQTSGTSSINMDDGRGRRESEGGIVVTTTYQVKEDGKDLESQESKGKW